MGKIQLPVANKVVDIFQNGNGNTAFKDKQMKIVRLVTDILQNNAANKVLPGLVQEVNSRLKKIEIQGKEDDDIVVEVVQNDLNIVSLKEVSFI